MSQVRYTTEKIIPKVREREVVIAQGVSVKLACRQEYGVLRMDQAKRFKDLEKENARLKKLLAEAEIDKAILREAARETSEPGEASSGGGVCAFGSGSRSGFGTSRLPDLASDSPTVGIPLNEVIIFYSIEITDESQRITQP